MQYLLDTHTLIWVLEGDKRLSKDATSIIKNTDNRIVVSIISFWEISIKRNLDKINLAFPTSEILGELQKLDIELLNLQIPHLVQLESLPLHHRDPFDRLLIAQAQSESLSIISKDSRFPAYEINTVW